MVKIFTDWGEVDEVDFALWGCRLESVEDCCDSLAIDIECRHVPEKYAWLGPLHSDNLTQI